MTLELSDEQLRSLLHIVSLALYVTEPSHDESCEKEVDALHRLADRLYEAGIQNGHRDIATYDAGLGQYMLQDAYVNDSLYSRVIQDFEDDFFWNELATQLAERDLRARGGDRLDPVQQNERLNDLAETYMDAFTDHGVDRLHLIMPDPHQ